MGATPSLIEREARLHAEAVAEQARKDVELAQAALIKIIQANQKSQQKAAEAQLAAQAQVYKEMVATLQAERASREAVQVQTHKEMIAVVQAECAAIQKRANMDIQSAQEQVEKSQERDATADQEATDALAEERVKMANAAKEEAERSLKEGIQPVVTPTPEEISAARRRARYHEHLFHIAVTGVAGGGKSSLINAFRGLRNKDTGSAATGVTETMLVTARYASPNMEQAYAWYDIPGADTLKIPDWQYFTAQELYAFDGIIVLFDNHFTMTDIAILANCRRFEISTYIVRSKADQHIRNIMNDMGYESEDRKKTLYQAAQEQFIQQTRQSVKDNLESAHIPDQRVYIVSNKTMLDVVKEKQPENIIHEVELLNDLEWSRTGPGEEYVAVC
ncbi:interferon-inducible GTPase-domain-containing protein [Suillus fuscotomentosus]|uniref:Interferon-inducible GTPase-domain-containing protein n=1 Tax=Suillus fuscotomentosus TaxID=1912939 RepID=A0AAD4EB12_9AGAM|nr:interferon-inducible GTPase-domain-containing protein [Suillus fuscotomentosus]KAG1901699.1 interferon-inducible GTPase-domain-containing protein [Suillus fuscotomentosus]